MPGGFPYRTLTVGAVLGLSLFFALAFFAAPQFDDFCFGATWAAKGFVGGIAQIYHSFTGRIAAVALSFVPHVLRYYLGLDIFTVYQSISIVLLLLFVGFAFWCAWRLWPNMRGWPFRFAALAMAFAMIGGARSVRDLLYWHSASFVYSIPSLVTMLVFVWLFTNASRRTEPKWVWGAILAAASFVAALYNEFSGPMIVIVVLGSLVVRLRQQDMIAAGALHGVLIIAAALGSAIVALAPGNAVRVAAFAHEPDMLASLFHGPVRFIAYLGLRIDNYGVMGWLVLAALLTRFHDRAAGPGPTPPAILVWSPVAVFVLCGVTAFTAGFYGMGSNLPTRSQNQVYLVGFVALTLATVEGSRRYGHRIQTWIEQRLPELTVGRATTCSLGLMAASLGVLGSVHALVFDAANFRAEMRMRLATIRAAPAGATVAVPAIKSHPKILSMGEIDTDPKHWENQCLASYYGVAQVVLRPDGT